MIPFRERNKTVIGAVGILTTVALLAGAFSLDALVGGDEYQAEFSEAAGLKPNDEVRVAGVKVGKVLSVDLDDSASKVLVEFRVKDARLGEQSRADIRIKTLLGRKFLMLTPEGDGQLEPGSTIPLSRTTAPFDITEAFRDLATTAEQIDADQLAQSFTVLADTFRDTPDDVRASLEGLSRLSTTIASRDAQLRDLLDRSRGVTQVLAERDEDLTAFMADASLVLRELEARREAISRLLDTTTQLSEQLIALVRENRAQLAPTLRELEQVVAMLQRQRDNIAASVERLAPFVRVFANNLGNGRWFDTFVDNLTAPTLMQGCFGDGRQVEVGTACPGEQVNEPQDPRGTP
jgi:phospholipid/cholesterol/gamma-HCH transport system substrate-binding protein